MTTSPDTEFYRRFAARVRTTVATTAREGSPTMTDTTTVETTEAGPAVPATFLPAPDAPCKAHTWCTETGAHLDHDSKPVELELGEQVGALMAYLYAAEDDAPELVWSPGYIEGESYTSGQQLREQTTKIRAHLARLDAFADQYDAIRESAGEQPEDDEDRPEPITSVRFITESLREVEYAWRQYDSELRVVWDPSRVRYNHVRGALLMDFGSRVVDLTPDEPEQPGQGDGPAQTLYVLPPRATLDVTDITSVRAHLDRIAAGIVNAARIADDPRLSDPEYQFPWDEDEWFRLLHEAEVMDDASTDAEGGDVGAGVAQDDFHHQRLLSLVQSYAQLWGSGHGRTLQAEYAAQLAAAVDHLTVERARVAAEAEPMAPGGTWSVHTVENDVKVTGYLPSWADKDPSRPALAQSDLSRKLGDILHCKVYPGQEMTFDVSDGRGGREPGKKEVLRAEIWCSPYSSDPGERAPFGLVTVTEDQTINHLDPEGIRNVAAKLRAQAAVLDTAAADLAAAREDWAKNGGTH